MRLSVSCVYVRALVVSVCMYFKPLGPCVYEKEEADQLLVVRFQAVLECLALSMG